MKRRIPKKEAQTIQDRVLRFALRFLRKPLRGQSFHINETILYLSQEYGIVYTHKQIRDAYFRLRELGVKIKHCLAGWYMWS